MSRKLYQLENDKLKLSTIVENLPLYRFLDQSKAAILKLQPVWQTWCNKHCPDLPPGSAHMSAYEANCLTINANNSSTASLLKHQQESLLKAFQQSKVKNLPIIEKIKIRIDLTTTSAAEELHSKLNEHTSLDRQFSKPTQETIESIQRLQLTVKNSDLAETLGDLIETLKDIQQDD